MASYFWVGGTGTWDGTTNHFATTSGGTATVAAPTTADDVFFDTNSGAGTVTIAGGGVANCKTLTCTGFTGTITGSTLGVFGSATLANTMTFSASIALNATGTFTSAGRQPANVTINNATTVVTLADALTTPSSGIVTLNGGTLNTNGQTCSWGVFVAGTATSKTLTLGASAITLTLANPGANVYQFDTGNATNLAVTANTATVTIPNAGARASLGNAVNYNGLSFTLGDGTQALGANGGLYGGSSNTINNFTVLGGASKTDTFLFSGNNTFTGTLTFTGNSTVNRLLAACNSGLGFGSTITGATLTAAATSLTNVDFQDIIGAGTATWSGTSVGDGGGNTGITFTPAAAQTWVGTSGGNWSNAANWTSRIPLPQDDVIINAAFIASQTVTADMPRLGKSINWTGATGSPTWTQPNATKMYGSLTLISGMTWTGSGGITFAGRGAFTITSAGLVFPTGPSIVAPNGTYTLQDSLTGNSALSLSLFAGTLNTNGKLISIGFFSASGTGPRTLTMGGSPITILGSGPTAFNVATATNLTITANTATVMLTAANSQVPAGGANFNGTSFIWTNPGTSSTIQATGINNLTILGATNTDGFQFGTNLTITGTLTATGATRLKLSSNSAGTQRTISAAAVVLTRVDFQDIAGSGTATWSGWLLGNISNNLNITFSTRFWVGGTGNWTDTTHWSTSSGGTSGASVPTTATDVAIDSNSGVGTVTVDTATQFGRNLDCTGYTGTLTLTNSLNLTASAGGACTFSSGMTLNGPSTLGLQGGTVGSPAVLTTNGKTLPAVNIAASGSWICNDAFTSSGSVTLTSGTLNTNNKPCTWNAFLSVNSNTRTLTLGSSTVTLTAVGGTFAWQVTTTNFTMTANTATLSLTGGGTFNSDGKDWNGLSVIVTAAGLVNWQPGGCTLANVTFTSTTNRNAGMNVYSNCTVTGTWTVIGNSVINRMFVTSNVASQTRTFTAASTSFQWADFQDVQLAGSALSSMHALATLSSNNVTDATRTADTIDDGRRYDHTCGVWGPSTNIVTRSDYDGTQRSTQAGWNVGYDVSHGAFSGLTLVTDTDFPVASSNVGEWTSYGIGQGGWSYLGIGVGSATGPFVSGQTYTLSFFMKQMSGTIGQQLNVKISDGSSTNQVMSGVNFNPTTQVVRYTFTFTAVSNGNQPIVFITPNSSNLNEQRVYRITGVQVEQRAMATPLIRTTGASASRTTGRAQLPSSLLTAAQGWAAAKVRMGWAAGAGVSGTFPGIFRWGSSGNQDMLLLFINPTATTNNIVAKQLRAGVATQSTTHSLTWNAGDTLTFIIAWTATQIKVSVNGGAFVPFAITGAITGAMDALVDIGSGDSPGVLDGDVKWAAFGTGTLADADAATIAGLVEPALGSLPGTPTGAWAPGHTATVLMNNVTQNASIGDALGNTGLQFEPSAAQTWVGTSGGSWSDVTKWTSRVPLPQDDVTINAAFTASQTINLDMARLGRNIDFTGVTGSPTTNRGLSITNYVCGSFIVPSTVLISGSPQQTLTLCGRSSHTLNTAGWNFGYTVSLNCAGGIYTLAANMNAGTSGGLTITTGTLVSNGFNTVAGSGVALNGSSTVGATLDISNGGTHTWGSGANAGMSSGTGVTVRTIKFGGGAVVNLGTSGTVWNVDNGLTIINSGIASINITDASATAKTFIGAGLSYPTLNYKSTGAGGLTITGSNTFAGLDVECTTARTLTLPAGGTQTISGTAKILTLKGSAGQNLSLVSSSPGIGTSIVSTAGVLNLVSLSTLTLSSDITLTLAEKGFYEPFGGAAATQYAVSAWASGSGTVQVSLWDDVSGKQNSTPVTLTSTPVRLSKVATSGTGSTTWAVLVEAPSGQTGITFYVDGVQAEAKSIVTPTVSSDGSTASRSSARVQAPATLVTPTQGWVAAKIHTGQADTATNGNRVFFIGVDTSGTNRISGTLSTGGVQINSNGGSTQTVTQAKTWNAGDVLTVIFAWTASTLYVSVNGAPFTSAPRTQTPVGTFTVFDIGSFANVSGWLDGDVYWLATGTGTLSDADAATIAGFANHPTSYYGYYTIDASSFSWPSNAALTAFWPAVTSTYRVATDAYIFTGYVESWPTTWESPDWAEVNLTGVDAFELLANAAVVSPVASLTTAQGANKDLKFTATPTGVAGNGVTIAYVASGLSTPLSVSISTLAVTVNLATDGSGNPTSTANDIMNAINANPSVGTALSAALAPGSNGTGIPAAFAATNLSGGGFAQELTGTRINNVLNVVNWPVGDRVIDTGQYTIAAQTFTVNISNGVGVQSLAHIQDDVETSEFGYTFIDGQGRVVFHDHTHRSTATTSKTSQVTFGDDFALTQLEYVELVPSYDKTYIYNSVSVTPSGNQAVQTVTDSTSISRYMLRSLTVATQLVNVSDALNLAQLLLYYYKKPSVRFSSMAIMPLGDNILWYQALMRDIGDRITVVRTPPAVGGTTDGSMSIQCFIENVEWDVQDGDGNVTIKYLLSPLLGAQFFVLDDPVYGLLDSQYALAG